MMKLYLPMKSVLHLDEELESLAVYAVAEDLKFIIQKS